MPILYLKPTIIKHKIIQYEYVENFIMKDITKGSKCEI